MGFSPSQPDGRNDSLQSAVSPDGRPTLETQYRVPGRCGVAVKVAEGQTSKCRTPTARRSVISGPFAQTISGSFSPWRIRALH